MLLVIQFKLMNIVQYSYLLMTCNKSGCLWRIFLAVLTKAWIWFYVFFDLNFSYGTCNMSIAIRILSTESCLKRGVLMGWKQIRENCILQLLRERVVGGSVGNNVDNFGLNSALSRWVGSVTPTQDWFYMTAYILSYGGAYYGTFMHQILQFSGEYGSSSWYLSSASWK